MTFTMDVIRIVFILAVSISQVFSQDVVTHCFEGRQTSAKVKLECPADFTIVVQTILFGSNSYRECTYTRDTCVERPADINGSHCLGERNCSITARRMYSVDCGGYVDFFRVIYECFPVVVARNITFITTQANTPEIPRFGMDSPITKIDDQENGTDVGMILAVVGCILGTLYISVVCIVLAVLFRRNDPKKSLTHDEEQPTELDNSGFKGSNQLTEPFSSGTEVSGKSTEQCKSQLDSSRNSVSGRPGPVGRDHELQIFSETRTPSGRLSKQTNYDNNLQQSSYITPKSLFSGKDITSLEQSPDTCRNNNNNTVNQMSKEDSSRNDSIC